MMSLTHASTTVDAWLQWFATEKQAACRADLCTRYRLNALDAKALINAALLQVFRHWSTLQNPLAYLWPTLRHTARRIRYPLLHIALGERRLLHGATSTVNHGVCSLATERE
jgi:hypothetical protein